MINWEGRLPRYRQEQQKKGHILKNFTQSNHNYL